MGSPPPALTGGAASPRARRALRPLVPLRPRPKASRGRAPRVGRWAVGGADGSPSPAGQGGQHLSSLRPRARGPPTQGPGAPVLSRQPTPRLACEGCWAASARASWGGGRGRPGRWETVPSRMPLHMPRRHRRDQGEPEGGRREAWGQVEGSGREAGAGGRGDSGLRVPTRAWARVTPLACPGPWCCSEGGARPGPPRTGGHLLGASGLAGHAGGPHPLGTGVVCMAREGRLTASGSPGDSGACGPAAPAGDPRHWPQCNVPKWERGLGGPGSLAGSGAERPPCVATHGPAPAPPGGSDSSWLEASWPYKVVCGHLLGELQRLRPAPPMGTRARPGPRGRAGEGAC